MPFVKGRQKKKWENDVQLRQLAKKSTHVPSVVHFFEVGVWAFLGKGTSKTRGGKYFFRTDFFSSFSFDFFRCVG
jgi:hypothetical protein